MSKHVTATIAELRDRRSDTEQELLRIDTAIALLLKIDGNGGLSSAPPSRDQGRAHSPLGRPARLSPRAPAAGRGERRRAQGHGAHGVRAR